MNFCEGTVYFEGTLTIIILLFIIRVFSDSFSLEILTSIFNIISAKWVCYLLKQSNQKIINKQILYSTIFTIITLILMILDCNAISIIIFNFFKNFENG